MPRFFFNVRAGPNLALIMDPEGSDLPSLEAARQEAVDNARSLMSHAVLEGQDISSRAVEILDEEGHLLLLVPFADAFDRFG